MSTATATTDHATIRKWIEDRQGRPARVKTEGDSGILRVDFREPEEELEEISWDQFFAIFDDNKLAFLHQDKNEDGRTSRFNKFIDRD